MPVEGWRLLRVVQESYTKPLLSSEAAGTCRLAGSIYIRPNAIPMLHQRNATLEIKTCLCTGSRRVPLPPLPWPGFVDQGEAGEPRTT